MKRFVAYLKPSSEREPDFVRDFALLKRLIVYIVTLAITFAIGYKVNDLYLSAENRFNPFRSATGYRRGQQDTLPLLPHLRRKVEVAGVLMCKGAWAATRW